MHRSELAQRLQAYDDRLAARERSALVAISTVLAAFIVAILVLKGTVSEAALVAILTALAGALAMVGLWVGSRAWILDRAEGVIAPCPSCGADLVCALDEIEATGCCPRCNAEVEVP